MASDSLPSAEEIQRQMQAVRSSLRADVKELVDNARDMTDWHYYVRRYPLASVAVAAAAGFIATSFGAQSVGNSTKYAPPPTPTLDSNANASQAASQSKPPESNNSSMMGELLNFGVKTATSALTRAALAIASQQLTKFVDGSHFAAAQAARKEESTDVQSHFG